MLADRSRRMLKRVQCAKEIPCRRDGIDGARIATIAGMPLTSLRGPAGVGHYRAGEVRDAIVVLTALDRSVNSSVLQAGLGCRWLDHVLPCEIDAPMVIRGQRGEQELAPAYAIDEPAYAADESGVMGWTEAVLEWAG